MRPYPQGRGDVRHGRRREPDQLYALCARGDNGVRAAALGQLERVDAVRPAEPVKLPLVVPDRAGRLKVAVGAHPRHL